MSTPDPSSETTVRLPSEGLVTLTYAIYSLHAFSALSGLLSYTMVVVAFLTEVTRVGCGLAGYTDAQIAPMFADAPVNCDLPQGWRPGRAEETT